MHQNRESQVKVKFPVIQEEEGFPPVTAEYLWCTRKGPSFVVDNIPFYVQDISLGDTISAGVNEDGELFFHELLVPSSNSTIRVLVRNEATTTEVVRLLESFGCAMEGGSTIRGLIAVSAPREAELVRLFEFLDSELERGTITFEEASVRYK